MRTFSTGENLVAIHLCLTGISKAFVTNLMIFFTAEDEDIVVDVGIQTDAALTRWNVVGKRTICEERREVKEKFEEKNTDRTAPVHRRSNEDRVDDDSFVAVRERNEVEQASPDISSAEE